MKLDRIPGLVSVVMPVYNGEKYIRESIKSVLDQTYGNFELLVINDGSSDSSMEIVREFEDPRIILLENDQNMGVSYTRNVGLDLSKGEFLAWIDCDDLIDKRRIEIQYEFMRENPQIGICGTYLERFNEGNSTLSTVFLEPELIKAGLIFKPAVLNATSMYRLSLIDRAGLRFNPKLAISEDYNFYVDACFHFPIVNLPKKLYFYRASETSIMKKYDEKKDEKFQFHKVVYTKWFEKLQIPLSEKNFQIHDKIGSTELYNNFEELKCAFNWLKYLKIQNDKLQVVDENALNKVLGSMLYFICKKSSQIGLPVFLFFLRSKMNFSKAEEESWVKLFIRCLIKYDKF